MLKQNADLRRRLDFHRQHLRLTEIALKRVIRRQVVNNSFLLQLKQAQPDLILRPQLLQRFRDQSLHSSAFSEKIFCLPGTGRTQEQVQQRLLAAKLFEHLSPQNLVSVLHFVTAYLAVELAFVEQETLNLKHF